MSTENEGAAVTPAAGPGPTPPAPVRAPSTGAPTSREDGDFSLPSPDSSDPVSADAATDADRTQKGPDVQDTVVPKRESMDDTLVQPRQGDTDAPPPAPHSAADDPGIPAPQQPADAPVVPDP
ncbi:protease, partial [Streptomyces nanshensis]